MPEIAHAPWTLRVAAWLTTVQVSATILAVLADDRFPIPGRVLLTLCVALGFLFSSRTLRLKAGAAFGLMMFEVSMVLVALGAGTWHLVARLGLGLGAAGTIALVLASLHAFPSPELPVR